VLLVALGLAVAMPLSAGALVVTANLLLIARRQPS
jgi:hypothetical protein